MSSTLAQRLLAGDRRALARGISLVEDNRAEGWQLVREVYPHTGSAAVVGFTGPPGVGKSTLIGALTRVRREAGRTVGVLSIDPSSPFTHGALLGDRIRLGEHFLDPGVFIRSMANRGALGGLSEAALQAALLLDAAGREDVFVETVGVGQAEVDIIDHADTVVLVLMPGSGDSIQALKAGVMEIPDVIVINKADHPLTDTMVREIRGVLSLANLDRGERGRRPPLAGADRQDRGRARPRHRGAGGASGGASRAHPRRRPARRAPPAQPARRGAGAGERPHAPSTGSPPARRRRARAPAGSRSSSAASTRRARRRRCWSGSAWARKIWRRLTRPEIRAGKLSRRGNVGLILFERFLSSLHLGAVWCNVLEANGVVVGGTTGSLDVRRELESRR